jgi:hypothetical protein
MDKMNYQNIFQRNIGFVNEDEQAKIRQTPVFIVGVGGMGGTALMNLVRMGYENIGIADIDTFDISNINRQLFCNVDTVGMDKAEASVGLVHKLNPAVKMVNWGHDWQTKLTEICKLHKIIINGCDDIEASNHLYNFARKNHCTVIDAYTASVPSVYVTRPTDPSPLMRWTGLSDIKSSDSALIDLYKVRESEYVMTYSNSLEHIHLELAIEMIQGKRSRMSLAPMVITTGCLMAYQVLFLTISKKATNYHGFFLDPSGKITKRSWGPKSFVKKMLVKYFLNKWMKN